MNRLAQLVVAVLFIAAAVEGMVHHYTMGGPSAASGRPVVALTGVDAGSVTPEGWADALLSSLGDPSSAENMRAVTAWERAEGGHWANDARFNPLNTTLREPGSTSINGVGVQAYTSWDEGLTATRDTLRNSRYGGILAALSAGDCAGCVAAAVAASPWGTGWFPV
jgi:hypothetical protein